MLSPSTSPSLTAAPVRKAAARRSIRYLMLSGAGLLTCIMGILSLLTWRTMWAQYNLNLVKNNPAAEASWALAHLSDARHDRPGLSNAWLLTANWISFRNPQKALVYARHAVMLDPTNWRNWHELGMIEFQLGNQGQALHDLRQAAAYNRGFLAHYQLANMAVLLHDRQQFWTQIGLALRMAPPLYIRPSLDIAWRMANTDVSRFIGILPARIQVQISAIHFLARRNHLATAYRMLTHLDCPSFRMTGCRHAAWSVTWHAIHHAYFMPRAGITPAQMGISTRLSQKAWNYAILNFDFQAPRLWSGKIPDPRFRFPWRGLYSWVAGSKAEVQKIPSPVDPSQNRVRMNFSGYQPGSLRLFHALTLVRPGERYEISIQAGSSRLAGRPGLWLAASIPGQPAFARLPITLSPFGSVSELTFQVPNKIPLLDITLEYQRPLGQVPWRGTAWISKISMVKTSVSAPGN